MRRDAWGVLALAAITPLSLAAAAAADSHEQPAALPYSIIAYEKVDPADVPAYETNNRDWIEAFKAAGMGPEWSWRMYAGPNFTFAWVMDIPNLAYLDTGPEREAKMAEAVGQEKLAELIAGVRARSSRREIVKRDPGITYMPDGGMGEVGFVRVSRHTVKPGREGDFRKLAMKVVEARQKTASPMALLGDHVMFGRGSYLMITVAKDAVSYHSSPSVEKLLAEVYGAEQAGEIGAAWRELVTDYETSDWYFRPDLSYLPGLYDGREEMEKEGTEEGE